jgi:hypothetical protein
MNEKVEKHIEEICREAGLNSMPAVMVFIVDRENVSDETLLSLTDDDIMRFYDNYVVKAVNDIEDELLEQDDEEGD